MIARRKRPQIILWKGRRTQLEHKEHPREM